MKNLFYLFYVLLGVAVLFQASRLISITIEKHLFEVPVNPSIEVKPVNQSSFLNPVEYDLTLFDSPLFHVPKATPAQITQAPQTGVLGVVEEADSPLLRRYELNGVILLPGEGSIALIKRIGERESGIYHKGDMLDGFELVKIERYRVFLSDGLKTTVLPMYYRYTAKKEGMTLEPLKRREEVDFSSGSRVFKKVLSRSDIENRLFSKANQILSQIAISPYMVDGNMEGLRLVRVPSDNIVYELGARSGDIIRRVNGHELKQVDQMYNLWENIKDDSFITVELERGNQLLSYSFEIRE
jgi:type II secretion system protein C